MNIQNLILGILLFIAGCITFGYELSHKKTYCWVIRHKINATRWGKHTAHADPIFVVRFDETKKDYEVHPTWGDFMDLKVGDRVCYTLQVFRVEGDTPWVMGLYLVFMFGGLVLVIYTLMDIKE